VQSELGKGSHFWFRIPLHIVEPPDLAATTAATPDLGSAALRILLVDDNPVNVQVARFMCQSIWPQALIRDAASGAQCLALLEECMFDVVLMDMFMPGMSGAQTCQTIREQLAKPLCHIPIIGLTASTHAQDRQICIDAGMNDVLSKPMDKASLASSVNTHVHAAKRQRGEHVH
jgi:CheY-like chemotaxis protein